MVGQKVLKFQILFSFFFFVCVNGSFYGLYKTCKKKKKKKKNLNVWFVIILLLCNL